MDKENRMLDARILQGQGYTQAEIGAMIGVSDRTVRNYLSKPPLQRVRPVRPSRLDPYKQLIVEQLEENPSYNGELLYERIVNLGFTGKKTVFKAFAAQVRRRVGATAVQRFETEPGRQAQVDWKEFGKQTVDGRTVKLYAFVMVLGYSRKPFVRFTTSMDQPTMLACHVLAFRHFDGIPHEILYDNMRTAFAPDADGCWRPTKRLLALAAHYGFTPRHCRVRRPETKGKVERTVGYLGNNFWPRMEGLALSLGGLNADVMSWLGAICGKPLADFGESRAERFARERGILKPIPLSDFDVRQPVPLIAGRESTVRFETNRYSVPPAFIGENVLLLVHPLSREAELIAGGASIRSFTLDQAGSHSIRVDESDRQAIQTRWARDRERIAIRRAPKRRVRLAVDVEIRSPAAYEAFAEPPATEVGVW